MPEPLVLCSVDARGIARVTLNRPDKNNAYNAARAYVRAQGSHPVPVHLRNAPTRLMKELGYGRAYRYAHDEPHGYAAGETYMPDGVEEPRLYRPVERGLEAKIREKLAWLRELDGEPPG